VSAQIKFWIITGEKKVLEMVNACVSHEMRNPINSIFAMIMKQKDHASSLICLVSNGDLTEDERRKGIEGVVKDMVESINIQDSSTQLLNFYVSDLLCLSQIEKGVFRKVITIFDVRLAIQEVIMIQKDKADFNQIELRTEFIGFEEDNFMICTDRMRLK
jgi:signal transduction histidine kinase